MSRRHWSIGAALCAGFGSVIAVASVSPLAGLGAAPAAAAPAPAQPPTTWTVDARFPAVTTVVYAISCGSSTSCQANAQTVTGPQLLGTADGGTTWSGESLPTGVVGLGGVSCGSATACLVVAATPNGGREILATSDGGLRWHADAIPSGVRPLSVSCPTAADCVVIGGTSFGSGAAIVTTDGGSTWTTGSVPPTSNTLDNISCGDAADCQAVGQGEILASSDGGMTWTADTVPSDIGPMYDVSCPTAAACVAVGQSDTGTQLILGSSDGGGSWTPQTPPSGVLGLTAVACSSATACRADGESLTGTAVAASTDDGGATWSPDTLPAGVQFLTTVACVSGSGCQAGGASTSGTGALLGAANGSGSDWTSESLPIEPASLAGVDCSSTTCAAVGGDEEGNGLVLTSPIGSQPGGAWSESHLPAGTPALAGVSCSVQCRAIGFHDSLVTNSAGAWVHRAVPASTGSLNDLSCLGSQCWSAGATTTGAADLLASANSGSPWQTSTSLPSGFGSLRAVSCTSQHHCAAVARRASDGRQWFLATYDGGVTWRSVTAFPAGVEVTSIACTTSSECEVAGSDRSGQGVILGTSDYGHTWQSQQVPKGVASLRLVRNWPMALGTTAQGRGVILTDYAGSWTKNTVPASASEVTGAWCVYDEGCLATAYDSSGGTMLLAMTWGGPFAPTSPAVATNPAVQAGPASSQPVGIPSGFIAASASWSSTDDGDLLGSAPCAATNSGRCATLLGTQTGGDSWGLVGRIPVRITRAGHAGAGVSQYAAAVNGWGWAYGPSLYTTRDGGRSFTRTPIPGGGQQIMSLAAGPNGAFAVVSPCSYVSACRGTLSVWFHQNAPNSQWREVMSGLPRSLWADVAVSGRTVYVIDSNSGREGGANLLEVSTDRGRTFTRRSDPCSRTGQQAVTLQQAVPLSGERVDFLCIGNAGGGEAGKWAFVSHDAGRTAKSAGMLGLYGIQAMMAASPSGNIAVASQSIGTFMYVNDAPSAGMWNMVLGFSDGGAGWGSVQYTTDATAFAVYAPSTSPSDLGKVLVTRDAGRNWAPAPV